MGEFFTAFSGVSLTVLAESAAPSVGASAGPMTPVAILCLCVVAALATWLMLPGTREIAIRRVGAGILLAAGLIFAALLVRWTVDAGGMSVYFWAFSGIALFASVRVITHTKPVYSALYFVLTVFATAGLFVLMWAEFMAAALVLIYAGAILITYVFVIMLASESITGGVGASADSMLSEHDAVSRSPLLASAIGFAIAGLLVFLILDKGSHIPAPAGRTIVDMDSAPALGEELIANHAGNLQLSAIVLTLAMVGAITLARRRVIVSEQDRRSLETVTIPGTPVDDNPHSIPVYGTTNPRHKAYPEN